MEKQIKKNGGTFNCFRCKKDLNFNFIKCPSCGLITLFGITKNKKKQYFIILLIYTFAIFSLWSKNQGFF